VPRQPQSSATERSTKRSIPGRAAPPIFIVSDATGHTAEMVVRAALTQFRGAEVRLHIESQVRELEDVRRAVKAAAKVGGLIVHTLVSPDMRAQLLTEGRARQVPTIDLLGPLLLRLEDLLALQPLATPGLFRDEDIEYRRRFDVMDFTVRHDDGQDPRGVLQADLVLVGVSRTSKTPLSMFLALRGLRVANVPIVQGLPLPDELNRVPSSKVVGLTIKAERLLELRRSRVLAMETPPKFPYADARQIWAELEYAQTFCARAGWPLVDVTDKSIEEVAGEVLVLTGREQPTRRARRAPGVPASWRRSSE
jgi:[pyruvate, water dikinase]-phosphate phosphotransferase / [pyruvate, water dikinase] kinase